MISRYVVLGRWLMHSLCNVDVARCIRYTFILLSGTLTRFRSSRRVPHVACLRCISATECMRGATALLRLSLMPSGTFSIHSLAAPLTHRSLVAAPGPSGWCTLKCVPCTTPGKVCPDDGRKTMSCRKLLVLVCFWCA